MGLDIDKSGRIRVNAKTLETSLRGVFAGGDLVTGPNTVIDAVAAGKKAAESIDRYLQKKPLAKPATPKLPSVYVEPAQAGESEDKAGARAATPSLAPAERMKNYREVEMALPETAARTESRRCLRCDLAFTEKKSADGSVRSVGEGARHG
jgi:pyruvate/2-oxoglutarate dehydrogenase complex dihydrolipoamide dehydrogenase (E3) component